MRQPRSREPFTALVLTALALSGAACTGGSSTAGGGAFYVTSCSLGCSGGAGSQVSCNFQNIHENEEIVVEFSKPVDFSTVIKTTFQVSDPGGTFPDYKLVPGAQPNEVVFRPIVSFAQGTPSFGLAQNGTYELLVPGVNQDSGGPWIRSVDGEANRNRMECFLAATEGIEDKVVGSPTVSIYVDVVSGPGTTTMQANAGTELVDVATQSEILFVFHDIMNPATLADPVTKDSAFIEILVDPDGNTSTPGDQVPVFGDFIPSDPDEDLLETRVIFRSSSGFPSAGTGLPLADKRRVVVRLSPDIQDLGGNKLAGNKEITFVPQSFSFQKVRLPGELVQGNLVSGPERFLKDGVGFSPTEDVDRTGDGMWGGFQVDLDPVGQDLGEDFGILVPGTAGGSGRLGDLEIFPGEVLRLGTEGTVGGVQQIFGVGDDTAGETYNDEFIIDNYVPGVDLPGTGLYSADGTFAMGAGMDAVFEFSSINVHSGGRIEFEGTTSPRIYARGLLELSGILDVSGQSAPQHDSYLPLGGQGAAGGPAAGAGGDGGDRFDHGNPMGAGEFFDISDGGKLLDPAVGLDYAALGLPPFSPGNLDGSPGEGVGGGVDGRGLGGSHWPLIYPGNDAMGNYTGLVQDLGDIQLDPIGCGSPQKGSPGSGGGYAAPGGLADAKNLPSDLAVGLIPPPDTPGGDAVVVTDLDPDLGNLIGGSGGGGGGGSIQGTTINAAPLSNCMVGFPPGSPLMINKYYDTSSAGGGGGGGAVQLQAGRKTTLIGIVDAGGGDGGGSIPSGGVLLPPETLHAEPGGGGSGGAILLQSPLVQLASITGRLNIAGGDGGEGQVSTFGGDGGAGVLRVELTPGSSQDLQGLADLIVDENLVSPGGVTSPQIVFPATMKVKTAGPSAFSGAQSCWMQPSGSFFQLEYLDDDPGAGTLGWDMQLIFLDPFVPPGSPGFVKISSFRDVNDPSNPFKSTSSTIEAEFGSMLRDPDDVANVSNSSPIVVRFQGARSIQTITDYCGVVLDGVGSPILPGSVTPWVYHPAELNDYWEQKFLADGLSPTVAAQEASKFRPNLLRYQIVFDRAHPYAAVVFGITNFYVDVQPD